MCSSEETGLDTAVAPCRPARAPLSRTRIIDAALAYVDANCLADLSMRRLGGELGVEAMSLYRYFPSKAALLDGIVCRVLTDLELPAPGDGDEWESRARAFALSFRRIAREHPRLFPLLATVGPANDTLVDVTDRMIGLWREAGMDDCMAERAQRALHGFVTGSTLWDVTAADAQDARDRPALQLVRDNGRGTRAGSRTAAGDPEADFEFGLDLLLRGLGQRLAPAAQAPVQATPV